MKDSRAANLLRSLQDRTDLRQQFGLAMSLLSFLIVATLALGALLVGEREARNATSEGLTGLAATLADRLDRSVGQRAGVVEMLTRVEALKPVWEGDPEAARRLLQQALATIPNGNWLAFANTKGIVTAAANRRREGEDVSRYRWFQSGRTGTTIEVAQDLDYSLNGLGPDGGPYTIVELAAPVRDAGGRTTGVLALSLNWLWAASLRQETLNRSTEAATKELWILSRDGRVIIGPSLGSQPYSGDVLSRMHSAQRGSFSEASGEEAVLTGFAVVNDYPSLGWIVVARQREAVAFAAARNVASTVIVLGVLTAILAILASLYLARRISRPITHLAEEADLIERHSVDLLPRERGSREVVRLSSALRALILRIGFAEERTAAAELRAADVASRFNADIAKLRNLADTDPLTQLLNRRRFLDLASEAMELFRRDESPFGILMIDVDRFKPVNDRFGHAAGDRAIQWVGAKIAESVRPTDVVARFGGEEFIVLVPKITVQRASELGERIRLAIASDVLHGDGFVLALTASIGVALVDSGDRDVEDLIGRADLALYDAKAQGRNAVVIAVDTGLPTTRRVA